MDRRPWSSNLEPRVCVCLLSPTMNPDRIGSYSYCLIQLTSAYTGLHRLTPPYIGLHRLTPAYIGLHRLTPAYTGLHRLTSAYIGLQSLPPQYIHTYFSWGVLKPLKPLKPMKSCMHFEEKVERKELKTPQNSDRDGGRSPPQDDVYQQKYHIS